MVHIVVADKHAEIRIRLRALLDTRCDFNVCGEARDGREAVDLVCQKNQISSSSISTCRLSTASRRRAKFVKRQWASTSSSTPARMMATSLKRLSVRGLAAIF